MRTISSCLLLLLLAAPCQADDELQAKVIAAWESNGKNLGAVQLRLTQISTHSKQTKRSHTATLLRDQLIWEEPFLDRRWLYDGELWHEHEYIASQHTVRRIDQMPSMVPYNPQQHFMYDLREPFLSIAKTATFNQPTERADQKYAVQMTYSGGPMTPGQRFVVLFDEKQGLLPVESIKHRQDGSILRHTVMKYRYLKDRQAYLVENTITRWFAEGQANLSNFRTAEAMQSLETRVDKFELIESPKDGVLSLEFPVGTQVVDMSGR